MRAAAEILTGRPQRVSCSVRHRRTAGSALRGGSSAALAPTLCRMVRIASWAPCYGGISRLLFRRGNAGSPRDRGIECLTQVRSLACFGFEVRSRP